MKRRQFITLLAAAAAWSMVAHAQQAPLPVVAFIHNGTADGSADRVRAFQKGLSESGYADGRNVTIEYHWLEGHTDRTPVLVADVVRRRVAGIVSCCGRPTAADAKAATSTIPIVFGVGDDPVKLGLVDNLARPGGNATGINFFSNEVVAKRLELLHQLLPHAVRIAVIANSNQTGPLGEVQGVQMAARNMGLQVQVLVADTSRDIEGAFATLANDRPDALFVAGNNVNNSQRVQIVNLVARDRIPTIYSSRESIAAGGLISYGANQADSYRQMGIYVGAILKGTKPSDLPVLQSTKLELLVNLQTARLLGIEVPPTLLALADEVIE